MTIRTLAAWAILISVFTPPAETQSPPFHDILANVNRIVFLGDSITYDGRYVAYVEAWLDQHYPERAFEVINVGLPSETVSGLSEANHADGAFPRPVLRERLTRVLDATRPDLVIACYGMNCGIYLPLEEERFAKYREGIEELHAAVAATGSKIVLLTPPAYDEGNGGVEGYDTVLASYGTWLLSKKADGWTVVDLHGPMALETTRLRALQPEFTFQPDGVHPNDAGHQFIARQLIEFLRGSPLAAAHDPHLLSPNQPERLALFAERMRLMRDAWLRRTGHQRPGLPEGLPLDDAKAAAADLTRRMADLALAPARN